MSLALTYAAGGTLIPRKGVSSWSTSF